MDTKKDTMGGQERTQPVTKEDLNRLESNMNSQFKELFTSVNKLNVAVAVLQSRPEPEKPTRPCADFVRLQSDLENHMNKHEEIKTDFRKAAISGLVKILYLIGGCGVVYMILNTVKAAG